MTDCWGDPDCPDCKFWIRFFRIAALIPLVLGVVIVVEHFGR